MINDQITDSVTQLITYKEGHGGGRPSKIAYRIMGKALYNDAIAKYLNQSELHVPSIDECDTLHDYMGQQLSPFRLITREIRDEKTITLADVGRRIYYGGDRNEEHDLVLVYIEYMA
jgi:hypothetical protein